MQIVHVHVVVKLDCVESFKEASRENAVASIREPGVARFDVIQSLEDPTRFLLVEVYRTSEAPSEHKATAHYAKWRDTVAGMMAAPRTSQRFSAVYPPEEEW